jgi:hypothetical protein
VGSQSDPEVEFRTPFSNNLMDGTDHHGQMARSGGIGGENQNPFACKEVGGRSVLDDLTYIRLRKHCVNAADSRNHGALPILPQFIPLPAFPVFMRLTVSARPDR